MKLPAPASEEDLWTKAFAQVGFPVFLLDQADQIVRANREALAWMGCHNPLPPITAIKGHFDKGGFIELPPSDGVPASFLLSQPCGTTLVCLAPGGVDLVRDYVRLYAIALVQEDKVRVRDDRLEVYHELFTHDAPNYLTAIYGYLQMMQGQELPREKTQRYIDTSIRQVEALNHLIDTTRNIRQMENAPQGMMVPLDLGAMVGQAISSVQGSSGGKAVDIRNEVPLGAHRAMVEEKLGEVFRIIINNAVAYSERPVVNVSIEDSGSNWNLRFRDNGRGIPDDKKEFLFLRFHRLDKDKKIRGSGLSLSLAKVLVERQGGRIWVENAVPGDHTKGSVFVVSLPKA